MKVLGIDIGSSSIKAAILTGPKAPAKIARVAYETIYEAGRAEVRERDLRIALTQAIHRLGKAVKTVDLIAPTVMAPSWLAMDHRGKAITSIVTHQDRRAVDEAFAIENRVGQVRHLKLAGNRPFPGGISSTTWAWFNRHERSAMKRADLVGHLSTWLLRDWCGVRITDPSNAGFMGLFKTLTLNGWSDELIEAVGVKRSLLPEVADSNHVVGSVTQAAAGVYGLRAGTPMLAGCMDGSAAMLATGAEVGQLLNVCGSTDVLALVTDRPKPHDNLLTRPLGVGRKWLAVGTLAAAGTAIDWARRLMYSDLSEPAFYAHLANVKLAADYDIHFDPHLAGSRTSMDDLAAAISGLRLATQRDDLLQAICSGLSNESVARLRLLKKQYPRVSHNVIVTGGVPQAVAKILRRQWSALGDWRYRTIENATLAGLWKLANLAE